MIVKKVTVSTEFGGRTLSLSSGDLAKQASAAVTVQYGETVAFVATQTGPSRPGTDFFPLTVDYRERLAAAGKFAGGYQKREGRPTTKEILTCRLTDRPIRPLRHLSADDPVAQCGPTVGRCGGTLTEASTHCKISFRFW